MVLFLVESTEVFFLTAQERRQKLLDSLIRHSEPLTGQKLSEDLCVTRQIVVADIALLRAAGHTIIATPRGYVIPKKEDLRPTQTIASMHPREPQRIRDELYTIVDFGGEIVDVKVDHPVYGEITANLQIRSRHDADQFLENLHHSGAEPLLVLTDGLHLHTIAAPDQRTLEKITEALRERGFLASE